MRFFAAFERGNVVYLFAEETDARKQTGDDMKVLLRRCRSLVFWAMALLPAVAHSADTLAVYLVNPQPGGRSICELRFALSRPLPPNAVLRLRFPATFDLSEVQVVGSDRIDGGFRLRTSGQEVVVERSGRGHTIPAGREVDLKIANVRNPRRADPNLTVRVTVDAGGGRVVTLDGAVKWRSPRTRVER